MAEFTASVYQNEFLPDGGTDVNAIVTVTCTGAGTAGHVAAGDLLETVREGAGDLLESVRLVDDYRGTGLPEASKSLTFALRFRADDRTLTAAEATEAKQGAVRLAGERSGATLRE